MSGPDLIFFLQDRQNRFWGINSSGNVVLTTNPYALQFSPDGWDNLSIKNIRNKKYWAVDRTASLGFKYVEDAARILKHIFYVKGVEESVYLTVCEQRLDYEVGVSYGYWYKQTFKSEIDLSTFDHDGAMVTCNTLEDGLAKHLKANENTAYEIPLNTPDAINVKMDGIILNMKGVYLNPAVDGITDPAHILPISIITNESIPGSGVAFLSANYEALPLSGPYDLSENLNYIFYSTSAVTIRVVGTIKVNLQSLHAYTFIFQDNFGTQHYNMNPTLVTEYVGEQEFSFDFTANIPAGGKLFLFTFQPTIGAATLDYRDSNIEITLQYRHPTTYIKAHRPQFILNELINKMTEGEFSAADCPYFGNLQEWNKVFTSGDGIRGIEDAKLKISFAQFFDFWDTYDAVGIKELAKLVTLDRKKELTNDISFIDLGEISRPAVKFDKSFPFNELAIGYPDSKNEQGMLNGKNEVNTTFNFSLGTTKVPRKMDKVSSVKASCYDIENIRIATFQKDTTDNKNDNDNYALHVVDDLTAGSGDIPDHYELDRTYNDFVTGVDEIDSVFNLELSPKNCLLRSGDFIRSSLYKCDNKVLKFVSADRNAEMAYLNGPDVRVERANVVIGELADPFFLPPTITVEVDAPEDLLDELDGDPTKGFQFTFEGETYKIISLENSINPKTNKKQMFTGLTHPDNPLEKLIDYYG